LAWLDQQPSVDKSRKMGTTGYCMGGPLVMRTRSASERRRRSTVEAQFLIAIAANDDEKQPDAKDTLKAAFAKASLPAKVEGYQGAMHGWCPLDSHVYDQAAAEKAWRELLALLESALGKA
jgi:carboxymethylenebutenolidase